MTARPPDLPGITWRSWHAGDIEALVRHTRRIHEAEGLSRVPGPELFRWLLGQQEFDPASDGLIAIDDTGEIRGEAGTWAHVTPEGGRCFVWVDTTPDHAHLRPFMVAWAEHRARLLLADTPHGVDRVIRAAVEAHRTALAATFEEAGFVAGRPFATMHRSLDGLPLPGPLPGGITALPWSPHLDEAVRTASNASFADHWGSLPMTQETWRAMYRESETFRADLSFVAVHDRDVVSFCLVGCEEPGEIEIHRVGTIRAHRGRGIAGSLIVQSLRAAASAGEFGRASLDVDEQSQTNTLSLYGALGFEVAGRSVTYLKTL
jgi:mycothiol synthase